MTMRHYETHLYGYAYACYLGLPTVQAYREKCLRHGHTLGECMLIEQNPLRYIQTGKIH